MMRPLKALKALLLMLARRLRRFVRLSLEKPLILAILVILEGECEYRPSYGRGDIGTRLM
jgi:hypothetical protein